MGGLFSTVEFYVVLSVVAAAVVAVAAMPQQRTAVVTHFLEGELFAGEEAREAEDAGGELWLEVLEGNVVVLRRTGLDGVWTGGAVNAVVKVSGFDVVIEERVTPGATSLGGMAGGVVFMLDFLAPEWYHVRYVSERYGEHAAFSLHVRPGIKIAKRLIR